MRKYELLTVIKSNLDMEGIEKVVQNIEETIKTMGGQILSTDKMGRKRLAYEIQKSRDAFYVLFIIELPEDKVVDLRRYLKLNENVLREMVTVLESAKATC